MKWRDFDAWIDWERICIALLATLGQAMVIGGGIYAFIAIFGAARL